MRSDVAELGSLVIGGTNEAPIRLRDVARVLPGHADPQLAVRSPKGPAAIVNVSRRIGGDVLALDGEIMRELGRLVLPPGITVPPVYQQAKLVRDATSAVRDAILVGALLSERGAVRLCADRRSMLLATLTIPASLLAAGACLALRLVRRARST